MIVPRVTFRFEEMFWMCPTMYLRLETLNTFPRSILSLSLGYKSAHSYKPKERENFICSQI